ncbi:DsbA family oxidoreductase [Rhodobacteraceae bacterium NNCM2]|nr:DsbA family oxidoreductase [Coraliihabitans acroporae]
MVPLDIISDPICPWCYIGKTNLDRAIEQTGKNPFTTAWRIFQLNPDMPAEGIDRKQYLEWKFGGPEGAKQVYGRIAEAGRAAGLDMKLEQIPRTPNTFDAHRLIRWSQVTGNQSALVAQLFKKYFEEGADISSREVLLEAAESIGLERDVVGKLLDSDADREELQEEEATARQMGVNGVPCFIINGQHVVQGAQDTATWVKIIEELSEALEAQQESKP